MIVKRIKIINLLLVFVILISLFFLFSCSNNKIAELEKRIEELEKENVELRDQLVEEEPEKIMTEAPEEDVEIADELNFSYLDRLPTIWGKIRIVEPLLVMFSDIKVEEGFFLLNDNEVRITGEILGLEFIKDTFFDESGYFTMLSAAILNNSGEIKWSQDGYPINDSYISENEIREFLLINQYESSISSEDDLIIIAYMEGGMIEDEQADVEDINKGVFGLYEGKCDTLSEKMEEKKQESQESEEIEEGQEEIIKDETETQASSNIQPLIDSATDSLGNVNTNSWAKGSGGDWSSGGLDASPTIYIGDTLTFTINVSNATNLQYRFQYQPPGGSFITIQDWSSSNVCTWTVPTDAFGQWTVANVQVRNNDGLNYLGFCDDYTYLTYIVLGR